MLDKTRPHLQGLATGVVVSVVDRERVADDWGVHAGVQGALALAGVVVPIQSQIRVVETGPLSCAHVDLQRDCAGAAVHHHVRVV